MFAFVSHQKINPIRIYLLPRYIHKLVANPPSLGTLDRIDHEIKQIIKQILHLHPFTTDGLIYSEKSHGGLDVQHSKVGQIKEQHSNDKITGYRHQNSIRWARGDYKEIRCVGGPIIAMRDRRDRGYAKEIKEGGY